MDHEDWDLFAIVRSCKAASTNNNNIAETTPNSNTEFPQDTTTTTMAIMPCLKNATFSSSSSFPNLEQQPRTNGFQELHQVLFNFINHNHTTTNTQKQLNQLVQIPQASFMVSPNSQPRTPKSRKRESLQQKTVCHLTADDLSQDLWAWRKYGQKPIKGSPYPRNYYRCSNNKGCPARKQVERSLSKPGIFVVTYAGEHKHKKPAHRSSLAAVEPNEPPPPLPMDLQEQRAYRGWQH